MATYGRVHSNMRDQRQCSLSMVEITHIVCACVCMCVCMCVCVRVCVCVCLRAHLCSVLMCPHMHMYINFYLFVA